ncbi:MAG: hypothetical protein H7070_05120 [Saprospiraceae bacterium]|nr:hypothetical protein [Pyrinomonadaceae bacterium]
MSYPFSLEFHGNYIHVLHSSGLVLTPKAMEEIWASLAKVCEEYKCGNVLVEASKPERKLDTMAAFDSGIRLSNIKPGISLALCFYDYESDEVSEFFKTVARNRGTRVEFFSNIEDAKKWLDVTKVSPNPKISRIHGVRESKPVLK